MWESLFVSMTTNAIQTPKPNLQPTRQWSSDIVSSLSLSLSLSSPLFCLKRYYCINKAYHHLKPIASHPHWLEFDETVRLIHLLCFWNQIFILFFVFVLSTGTIQVCRVRLTKQSVSYSIYPPKWSVCTEANIFAHQFAPLLFHCFWALNIGPMEAIVRTNSNQSNWLVWRHATLSSDTAHQTWIIEINIYIHLINVMGL